MRRRTATDLYFVGSRGRYHSMIIERDPFGSIRVVRNWDRIGGHSDNLRHGRESSPVLDMPILARLTQVKGAIHNINLTPKRQIFGV